MKFFFLKILNKSETRNRERELTAWDSFRQYSYSGCNVTTDKNKDEIFNFRRRKKKNNFFGYWISFHILNVPVSFHNGKNVDTMTLYAYNR